METIDLINDIVAQVKNIDKNNNRLKEQTGQDNSSSMGSDFNKGVDAVSSNRH